MARAVGICLMAGVAAVLTSCTPAQGPAKKICYPVKGKLMVSSQPASGATVIFHPEGSVADEWASGYPRAQVAADGSFELETYGDKDGAPAGEYRVLVTWTQSPGGEESEDTQMIDRLRGRYSDYNTAKLKATVQSGPTELAPFSLP